MMPPKKSKAARLGFSPAKPEDKKEEAPPMNGTETDNAEDKDKDEIVNGTVEEDEEEEKSHVNIFEETVVDGKRKRFVPPGETKLTAWVESHLEEKEDVHYKFTDLYDAYVEECIVEGIGGCLDGVFRRVLKEKFPKGYALKEESKYKADIKQRKKINRPKIQGDTFKLKPKEVLEKTFQELGNPKAGVRFNTVRQYIAGKYPALRVDVKPNYVKNALFLGVRHGYVDLLRGVGKSGVYRLYVEGEEEEKEEEEETHKKKKKEDPKSDNENKDGEETGKEDGEDDDKDEKKTDDDQDEENDKEEKPAKKKKSAPKPQSRQGKIIHSDPAKIEDTFPLAITFGTEPKQCSFRKIANYINQHYPDTNVDTRLKAFMEKGAERGFWEHISGSVSSGTFKLTIDEFDPTDDDDMIGKVVNAIMACSEPKQCSAALLKNYVLEFHPHFKAADHPYKFKRALERAEGSRDLLRLSGIGGSGSFQLSYVFMPSPTVLAAQDTASDYEADDDDDASLPEVTELGDVDLSSFQDAYTPRPSKRRGKARAVSKTSFFDREMEFQKKRLVTSFKARRGVTSSRPQKPQKRKAGGKKQKGRKSIQEPSTDSEDSQEDLPASSDDDSNHSEEEYEPGSKKGKKARKEEQVESYKPRPTASRSGRARTPPKQRSKAGKAKGKKSPTKPAKDEAPKPKGPPPTKAALKEKPAPLVSDDEEETPKSKKAKKTPGKAKKKSPKAAPTPPAKKGSRSSSRRR